MKIFLFVIILLFLSGCNQDSNLVDSLNLQDMEQERVIMAARSYLKEYPITVTDTICDRSSGELHDYYSEGDYWWPNPVDPDGPYIRKDGMTNPENFTAHRKALRRLSIHTPALVAAYQLSGEKKYAEHALKHLRAWFIDEQTRMNPNLLYAQAIMGKVTGRGIGIIDTIHLVEVVQAILKLQESGFLTDGDFTDLKLWFTDYLIWITTHPYGHKERDNGNNHSTCWAMQVAQFAKLAEVEKELEYVREMYRTVLLPEQMAEDGSFPKELKRTKPYGYSLFNLDAMAMVCEIASDAENDLWRFSTEDGRSMQNALEYMYPFIADKSKWSLTADVMYFEDWPVRHPVLLFAGLEFNRNEYIKTWKTLEADPQKDEIVRNFFIRQPLLWVN